MAALKDPLKDSFRNFLFLVWKHVGLPQPTKIQYDIAKFLQHGPKRKMIQAFRGVGKTWVTAAYIIWRLHCDPDLKILVVSASKAHADNTTTFCLQIINTVPELKYLAPTEDQREAKIQFDVAPARPSRDPSVRSVGITGQITGSRADIIIADDIETSKNSETQLMREKARTAVEEFAAVLKPDGEIIYLGTPQCEDTLYRTLPLKGYVVRTWPARYPSPKQAASYGESLAPMLGQEVQDCPSLAGTPTDPERFSIDDLAKREAEYARSGFALQFMLDTSLSDATRYPLKLADLIIMNLNAEVGPPKVIWAAAPDLVENDLPNVGLSGDRLYRPMRIEDGPWVPYTGSVLAIDPSGRGKDETGYVVVKMLHGILYVTAWGGLGGGYEPETLTQLAGIAKREKVNHVLVEKNFGDGMFSALLQPILAKVYPVQIEEVQHSIQKEKRIIDTLEPVLNQHRLVIDRKLIQQDYDSTQHYAAESAQSYMGLYQLTRITKDRGCLKHDDRLDALSMGVAYWVESMAKDSDEALKETQDEALLIEMRKMEEHLFGAAPEEKTWITLGS